MEARGRVFKYGDNVDTDVIIPARYLTTGEPAALAIHCMEDIDPGFSKAVRMGDLIVGGANFGCGSSREHAPLAIKAAGVSCVIAASFARIFYRNAINIGLPIMECAAAAAAAQAGSELQVDFETGVIRDIGSGQAWTALPFPPFIRAIIEAGGLMAYTKAGLEAGRKA